METLVDSKLHDQIVNIIGDVNDMTIPTLRQDEYPQATTVSYVSDGSTIYFLTATEAQKAQNIEHDNRVSVTINRPYDNWNHIEGLSMAATAHKVSNPEQQEKIRTLLIKKFPQAAELEPNETEDFVFIQVDPTWVSVLDYAKGFGHTEPVDVRS